jgi:hypothetical protein
LILNIKLRTVQRRFITRPPYIGFEQGQPLLTGMQDLFHCHTIELWLIDNGIGQNLAIMQVLVFCRYVRHNLLAEQKGVDTALLAVVVAFGEIYPSITADQKHCSMGI